MFMTPLNRLRASKATSAAASTWSRVGIKVPEPFQAVTDKFNRRNKGLQRRQR
jgi:hypothetical protein